MRKSAAAVVASMLWIALLVAFTPAGQAAAAPQAAGAASQPECVWTGVERIVAVGDVHGDNNQFVKTLRAAEVIDEKSDWIAGKTHLVQIGDVLDRGPDSRKTMDLLMKLEEQSAKAGGGVHPLIGNHEAMVPMNDWRYVHPGEILAFAGDDNYRKAMSKDGKYGRWIRSHNAIVQINDILFVHAGLSPQYAKMSLAEINKAIRDQLINYDPAAKEQPEGLATADDGPLWDRSLELGAEAVVAKKLDIVFKAYGAAHMVIGHTPDTEGVLTAADNRLIRIDVGMSAFYKGPAACLVIEKGVYSEARAGQAKKKLFEAAPASQPAGETGDIPRGADGKFFGTDTPKNTMKIVYLIDRSNSMMTAFAHVKPELVGSISWLRARQEFALLMFVDGPPQELKVKGHGGLIHATPEAQKLAKELLDGVIAMDAVPETRPHEAIRRAFALKPELIYLLTNCLWDGPDVPALIADLNKDRKVKINTFLFVEKNQTGEKMLKKIAADNGGVYRFIDEKELGKEYK